MNAKYRKGQYVLHVKTNKVYQITDVPKYTRIELTCEPAYGYREVSLQKPKWIRSQRLMEEDGRFKILDGYSPQLIEALECIKPKPKPAPVVSARIIPLRSPLESDTE